MRNGGKLKKKMRVYNRREQNEDREIKGEEEGL